MKRRRCIGEAMTAVETTKERWCESEVNRVAGEICAQIAGSGSAKAEAYFGARSRLHARSRLGPGSCALR